MSRRIAIVTGTRAEYGLLEPIMRAVAVHQALTLHCIVTGTHLITDSVKDVAYPIAARVPMQRAGQTGRVADAAALGRGMAGFARVWPKLNPDVVLVLGDRIEAFAAAASAAVGGLRVAHVHGGDRAEGVADEALRHAISKLAHLHFPATAQSRRRLLRMGERPETVFNFGSPAVDGLDHIAPEAPPDAPPDAPPEAPPDAPPDAPTLLVMQHPIGDDDAVEARRMADTLAATADYDRLVLAPNFDPGRDGILRAIAAAKVPCVDHLPRARFVALLKGARALVGNSSAGLLEAAVCRTACVNIGPRQAGRESPRSVVSCDYGKASVQRAVRAALDLDLSGMRHPYGRGRTGALIAQQLATVPWEQIPLRKRNTF